MPCSVSVPQARAFDAVASYGQLQQNVVVCKAAASATLFCASLSLVEAATQVQGRLRQLQMTLYQLTGQPLAYRPLALLLKHQ